MQFHEFIRELPQVDPPLVLSGELQNQISRDSFPLKPEVVLDLLPDLEMDEDITEVHAIACLEPQDEYVALVFWKVELMRYTFHLATFNHKGELIDHKIIAGTEIENQRIVEKVAVIEDDGFIFAARGEDFVSSNQSFDPSTSKKTNYIIRDNGEITKI
jgi:hypothetical protein